MEGFKGESVSREERSKQDISVQVEQIEDEYPFFAGSGGYGMREAMWLYINDLPKGLHVVDLNSMGGDLTRFASDFNEMPEKMYIVDYDPGETKRKAPDLLERPEVVVSQQGPIEFEPLDPVDLVMANEYLRRIPEDKKEDRIKHLYSYMKPGGTVLWSDMVTVGKEEQRQAYESRKKNIIFCGYSEEAAEAFFEKERKESHPVTVDVMKEMMERVGFKDVSVVWHEGMFATIKATK